MKKIFLTALLAVFTLSIYSCRETNSEETTIEPVADDMGDELDDMGDEMEDVGEDIGDGIEDAGDDIDAEVDVE